VPFLATAHHDNITSVVLDDHGPQRRGEFETASGFLEVDTVAHCGRVLKGESARKLNLTIINAGRVDAISIRNNPSVHIRAGLTAAPERISFEVTGMDSDYANIRIMPTWSRQPLAMAEVGQ
jgi:hypothetical protein